MTMEQTKVWMSSGVTVEYRVITGSVTVEAKNRAVLGVLELDTFQARELQAALLAVLGEPLGSTHTGEPG